MPATATGYYEILAARGNTVAPASRRWFSRSKTRSQVHCSLFHHGLLGVPRKATADEIKRAYRRFALKRHPDRNKDNPDAEQRFKQVNEAYEVLGDAATRAKYDKYGEHWRQADAYEAAGIDPNAGVRWSTGPGGSRRVYVHRGGEDGIGTDNTGGFGSFDGFGDLFGGMFGGFRGQAGQSRPTRGEDVGGQLYLTLVEALRGCKKTVQLQGPSPCNECGGAGHANGQLCRTCGGTGEKLERTQLEVTGSAGVRPGSKIRLSGQGMSGTGGGQHGDLLVTIRLEPHPVFRVAGDNIELDLPVAPWELALGASVDVPTLDGTVTVQVPANSPNGRVIRLRGLGWPGKSGTKGNMLVRLVAAVPPATNERQREAYRGLSAAFG